MVMNDFLECLKEIVEYILSLVSGMSDKIKILYEINEIIQHLRDLLEEIKKADCNIIYKDIKEIRHLQIFYFPLYFIIFIILLSFIIYAYLLSYYIFLFHILLWILLIIMLFVMMGVACFISKKFSIKLLRHTTFIYFVILTIFLWISTLSAVTHKIIIFNYEQLFLEAIYHEFLIFIIFYVTSIVILLIKCKV